MIKLKWRRWNVVFKKVFPGLSVVFRNPRTASREKKGVLRQEENGLFETSLGHHSKTKLKMCDCGLVVAEQLRGDFRQDRLRTVPPVLRRAQGYVQGDRTRRSLKQWCWNWQEIDAGTLCTQTRCQRENKLSAERNTIVSQTARLGFGALPSFRNIPPPSARSGYIYIVPD